MAWYNPATWSRSAQIGVPVVLALGVGTYMMRDNLPNFSRSYSSNQQHSTGLIERADSIIAEKNNRRSGEMFIEDRLVGGRKRQVFRIVGNDGRLYRLRANEDNVVEAQQGKRSVQYNERFGGYNYHQTVDSEDDAEPAQKSK